MMRVTAGMGTATVMLKVPGNLQPVLLGLHHSQLGRLVRKAKAGAQLLAFAIVLGGSSRFFSHPPSFGICGLRTNRWPWSTIILGSVSVCFHLISWHLLCCTTESLALFLQVDLIKFGMSVCTVRTNPGSSMDRSQGSATAIYAPFLLAAW